MKTYIVDKIQYMILPNHIQENKRFITMVILIKPNLKRCWFYTMCVLSLFAFKFCDARMISPPELNAQRLIVEDKRVYLTIRNKSEKAWLIQSWIEDLDGSKQDKMVLPEFTRLEAFSSLNLGIYPLELKKNNSEKMHWLTVRIIPALEDKEIDKVVIPINYKLKVFHRPYALKNKERKPSDLEWEIRNDFLFIKNNSGFYYTFSEILFSHYKYIPPAKDFLPPYGETKLRIPNKAGNLLKYTFTDDFGNEQ
ncbi:molecular chaperone, partial [Salmonella enterica subsp. enterica]|nr:molecular chaperone [Salmonella enterica subsp. enterica serovar Abaetetuba]